LRSQLIFRFIPVLLLLQVQLIAQRSEADSMQRLILFEKDTTRIVELLNEIGWELKVTAPDTAKTRLLLSAEIAERNKLYSAQGDAYNYLGVLESIRENLNEAAKYWETSLQIRIETEDKKGQAKIYNNLGILYKNKNDFTKAILYYRQAELIYEELDNPIKAGNLAYNIAKLYDEFGHFNQAIEYIYKYLNNLEEQASLNGLDEVELADLKSSEADAYNLMGNVKYSLARNIESKQSYLKSMAISQSLGDTSKLANVFNNLGNLYSSFSWKYHRDSLSEKAIAYQDSSIAFYNQSLSFRQEIQDEDHIDRLKFNIATCERDKGIFYKDIGKVSLFKKKMKLAEDELERLRSVWSKASDELRIIQVNNALFEVYLALGKKQQALDALNTSSTLANANESDWYIQRSLEDFSKYYKASGQYEQALSYSEKYNLYRYKNINEKQIQDNEKQAALYLDQKNIREIERKKEDLKLSNLKLRNSYIYISIAIFSCFIFIFLFVRFRRLHAKIQGLLLNILPPSVVKRIQADATDDCATNFEAATIPPNELLGYLNKFFTAFDEIISEEGVERIKTIGDAYMCVSGVPDEYSDHAQRMIRSAFRMRKAVDDLNTLHRAAGVPEFKIRIGINSGPVSGGIVGVKKYAYDVWGDAVNVASRMESNARIGGINISEDTYALVKEELLLLEEKFVFATEVRKAVQVKGKGAMDMYTFK
jgi:adenylate cyclase